MDSTLKEWSGVCPYCANPITYTVAHLPIINDKGKVIAKCSNCSKLLLIKEGVVNPEHMTIHDGGRIEQVLDNFKIVASEIAPLKDPCLFDFNSSGYLHKDIFVELMENRASNPFLDNSKEPLYHCCCGENLEKLSFSKLLQIEKTKDLDKHYEISWVAHTKNWLFNADKIIVEFDLKCSCGKVYRSVMYTHMFLYGERPKVEHFLIANISPATSQFINGIYSKNKCKACVEKYALRWNLLSQKNYVATAFIGNQYNKAEVLEDLWADLTFCFSAEKSLLITKKGTKTTFEKKADKNGLLSHKYKYGRVSDLQKNAYTFERSHAKFYAGVLGDVTELISGSFNFTSGPSTENLIFSSIGTEQFNNNYLSPYGLSYSEPKNYRHFYYKSFGQRSFNDGYTISRNDLISRVLA